MVTQELLKKRFHYDPETGIFTRLIKVANCADIGILNGSPHRKGYRQTRIFKKSYLLHRLAWMYMTGEWPKHNIDHINGIPYDNRWNNLRDIPNGVNRQNMKKPMVTNKSGLLGVSFSKKGKDGNHWLAQLVVNKKHVLNQCFPTKEEAHAAYIFAKRKYHVGCTI